MFQTQNRETIDSTWELLCPSRSLWRRAWQDVPCFTTQHQTCKTKTDFWSQTGLVLRPTVWDHITGCMRSDECLTSCSPQPPARPPRMISTIYFSPRKQQNLLFLLFHSKSIRRTANCAWCLFLHKILTTRKPSWNSTNSKEIVDWTLNMTHYRRQTGNIVRGLAF